MILDWKNKHLSNLTGLNRHQNRNLRNSSHRAVHPTSSWSVPSERWLWRVTTPPAPARGVLSSTMNWSSTLLPSDNCDNSSHRVVHPTRSWNVLSERWLWPATTLPALARGSLASMMNWGMHDTSARWVWKYYAVVLSVLKKFVWRKTRNRALQGALSIDFRLLHLPISYQKRVLAIMKQVWTEKTFSLWTVQKPQKRPFIQGKACMIFYVIMNSKDNFGVFCSRLRWWCSLFWKANYDCRSCSNWG